MNSKSSAVIIGGYVVSKFMDNDIRIKPLKLAEKSNSITEQVTTESKIEVNLILQKLSEGKLTYDDLVKSYF